MLKSRLYDYSDADTTVKKTTDFIGEINNTQEDNVKGIDVVMSMYNLIDYSDNYSKTLLYGNAII